MGTDPPRQEERLMSQTQPRLNPSAIYQLHQRPYNRSKSFPIADTTPFTFKHHSTVTLKLYSIQLISHIQKLH